jgi:hypothetical protein
VPERIDGCAGLVRRHVVRIIGARISQVKTRKTAQLPSSQ